MMQLYGIVRDGLRRVHDDQSVLIEVGCVYVCDFHRMVILVNDVLFSHSFIMCSWFSLIECPSLKISIMK